MWYDDGKETHRQGVLYFCKDVDDDFLTLIRSDPSVKVVYIELRFA
jgi:hypothetical protein